MDGAAIVAQRVFGTALNAFGCKKRIQRIALWRLWNGCTRFFNADSNKAAVQCHLQLFQLRVVQVGKHLLKDALLQSLDHANSPFVRGLATAAIPSCVLAAGGLVGRVGNDNLYAQAKAIFAQRFIGIETIPDGWKKGNLLDIANYLNGLAMQKFRPRDDEVGLPVLKIKELRQGSCDVSSELCSPSIKPEYIVHDGDVIFSWSGSLLVDIWCGGTCGLNQHLFKVTSETYDQWFYYLWTAHHLERFIAIAADKATTMGHIKRGELEKAEVLIPSEKDYKEISSLMNPLFNLIVANRIEARKLAELRDELLPKLMSGEIDVSEVSV